MALAYQPAIDLTPPSMNRFYSRERAITEIGCKQARFLEHSEYFRVQGIDEAWERLTSTALLSSNWDSYGAEPPSPESRKIARRILQLLQKQRVSPTRLVPSAEGGIGIIFWGKSIYADIECLNSGEILTAKYRGKGTPVIQEIGHSDAELIAAIEQIRVYLAS